MLRLYYKQKNKTPKGGGENMRTKVTLKNLTNREDVREFEVENYNALWFEENYPEYKMFAKSDCKSLNSVTIEFKER